MEKRVNFELFTLDVFVYYIYPEKRPTDFERQICLIFFAQEDVKPNIPSHIKTLVEFWARKNDFGFVANS